MTFIDTRLSPQVNVGFAGGPEWNTLVRQMANGLAMRRGNWSMPHHRYTADYTLLDPTAQNEILAAFIAARGQVHSFRFKDWNDFRAINQAMAVGDGTNTPRQLTKAYTFGTETYTRTITLPISNTVAITANGVPLPVTVNALTGMVTPVGSWPTAQVIKASFEFDVRVRFGADFFQFDRNTNVSAAVGITLVEAFTP
jgi:uncharacterized protein (TIGR02217 family)